jgi:hypothetical protein
MLAHCRSQHNNQSWLGALTTILDTSALFIADLEGPDWGQAKLTFAISRRVAVNLVQMFAILPLKPTEGRLSANELRQLRIHLATVGLPLREDSGVDERLTRLRQMYEPHILALSVYLSLTLSLGCLDNHLVATGRRGRWIEVSLHEGGTMKSGRARVVLRRSCSGETCNRRLKRRYSC